jgi:hypothetical protein
MLIMIVFTVVQWTIPSVLMVIPLLLKGVLKEPLVTMTRWLGVLTPFAAGNHPMVPPELTLNFGVLVVVVQLLAAVLLEFLVVLVPIPE